MKHVPLRICVSCRNKYPKRDLLRVVYTPEGDILLDERGKVSGRGAYVCKNKECIDMALSKDRLSRSLKIKVPDDVKEKVAQEY